MHPYFFRLVLAVLPFLSALRGFGQSAVSPAPVREVPTLSTDRPGIANSTRVTPVGSFLLESGFEYYRQADQAFYNLPTVTFRTGLNDRFECRLTAGLARQVAGSAGTEGPAAVSGASPVTAGTKINLCAARGWRPAFGVQLDLVVPRTGHPAYRSAYVGNSLYLLFENDLSDRLNLNYNLGMSWSGGEGGGTALYALCLNYQVAPRVGVFAEHYSACPERGRATPGLDGGVALSLTPNVQFDWSAGLSLRGGPAPYFLASGLCFRLNRR